MCSPWVLVHALSFTGLVCAFVGAALLDGKLVSHFKHAHPEVWADLALRKVRFTEGDMQGAAMQWYLWRGEHKKLEDQKLNSLVFKGWVLGTLFVCSALAVILSQDQASAAAYRTCLGF